MPASLTEMKVKVTGWLERHRRAVLYDEESSVLLDVASGKSARVDWLDVKACEEKAHPETGDSYLVLLFENGNQIALVDPGGIAFAPSEANTGPVRDLPPVVCFKDFLTLKGRIDHYLYGHRDEPPPRECLDLIMVGIAILDGARRIGFETGELEEELNRSLEELEKRTGKGRA